MHCVRDRMAASVNLLDQFLMIRRDCREAPQPDPGDPPDVTLRFIARKILGAMLTWRFAVFYALVVLIAWIVSP